MLDLVRDRLEASGTAHCYLAGLTKNRQEEVDRFQYDDSSPSLPHQPESGRGRLEPLGG